MFLQPGLRRSLPVMHVAARPTAVARATPAPAVRVANPVPVTDTVRRRRVPAGARTRARPAAHAGTAALRRADAARARNRQSGAVIPRGRPGLPLPGPMPSLIFRKGLDLKHAVAGHAGRELSQPGHRADQSQRFHLSRRTSHAAPRARVRVLLRRRSRGGLRLSDAPALSGSRGLSDRRNHPQPARQR